MEPPWSARCSSRVRITDVQRMALATATAVNRKGRIMRTMQDVVVVKDLAAYGEELTDAEMVTVMGGKTKTVKREVTVTFTYTTTTTTSG